MANNAALGTMNTHQDVDYAFIKKMARELGCRVTDLIVLAPQNDPFYVGTPSDRTLGEWFAELWQGFGYTAGVHLRRVHYRLVSQDPPILTPNGLPYENTENCWDVLGRASKAARYLGLVDAADFDDRRNREPILYAPPPSPGPTVRVGGELDWWDTELPDFPDVPNYILDKYEARQPYMLELWCEKSTMNDVLEPLCQSYHANLMTALGEFSVTAALAGAQRIKEDGRSAVLLYISDFDPAGQCMPVSLARKLEYFVRELDLCQHVIVVPIALTQEQCRAYRLPRTPIKESERRRGGFEDRFGEGATELDALEALHPGELGRIVRDALRAYCDPTLDERVFETSRALRDALREREQTVLADYEAELDDLREEYTRLQAEFTERLADHGRRREGVWQAIRERLVDECPDVPPVPEAAPVEGLGEPLYDSDREYLGQIAAYKAFQGREVTT